MFRRRQRRDTSTAMNYLTLPSDEEDDDLLDGGSDHETNYENGRKIGPDFCGIGRKSTPKRSLMLHNISC